MAATTCNVAGSAALFSYSGSSLSGKRIDFAALQVVPASKGCRLVRCEASSSAGAEEKQVNTREFCHTLTRGKNYNKSGFGYKKEMLEQMDVEFTSDLVKTLKENNFEFTWGNVTVKLANSYGFCWGVERAKISKIQQVIAILILG